MPENMYSIGRAGSYDYGVDIDDCIEQVLELKKILWNIHSDLKDYL